MKKAKIFLSAIAVFAVVAGALAFKAKTYSSLFCTRNANTPGVCDAFFGGEIDVVHGIALYYTSTNNPNNCAETQCESTTFLTLEERGN